MKPEPASLMRPVEQEVLQRGESLATTMVRSGSNNAPNILLYRQCHYQGFTSPTMAPKVIAICLSQTQR